MDAVTERWCKMEGTEKKTPDTPVSPYENQVLDFLTQMGEEMLRNGAELFRVEETLEKIAKAYGMAGFHSYVLANGLFASLDHNGKNLCAQVRSVPLSATHLGRVVALNDLSREIAEGRYTLEEAVAQLERVRQIPVSRPVAQIASAAVGCACYCVIFGGSWLDSLAAALAGAVLYLFLLSRTGKKMSRIMVNLAGSALVTALAVGLSQVFPALHFDKISIGSIIPLVPGIPLTNGIRDLFNGDYLSGTTRMIDAVLVGFCIAAGVGCVLNLSKILLGVTLL